MSKRKPRGGARFLEQVLAREGVADVAVRDEVGQPVGIGELGEERIQRAGFLHAAFLELLAEFEHLRGERLGLDAVGVRAFDLLDLRDAEGFFLREPRKPHPRQPLQDEVAGAVFLADAGAHESAARDMEKVVGLAGFDDPRFISATQNILGPSRQCASIAR